MADEEGQLPRVGACDAFPPGGGGGAPRREGGGGGATTEDSLDVSLFLLDEFFPVGC